MLQSVFSIIGFVICLLIGSVCSAVDAQAELLLLSTPTYGRIEGSMIQSEPFDIPDAWETYIDPMGVELGVEDGVYRAYTMNEGYVWGLNAELHTDVILEVEATPMTIHYESGFGIMCRADVSANGDGYYFMINANGYYSIRRGEGDQVVALIDWQPSEAISTQLDLNTLRAVCVGSHLAFYVNDVFVAETDDDTYSDGYAGLAIAASTSGDADVAFDNVVIYRAAHP